VIVKEVSPSALAWLEERFAPLVVFLVRHPAAVASSMRALGWGGGGEAPDFAWWSSEASRQARALAPCLERLSGREDARVVRYEDLCLDPIGGFRELYAFARLPWTEEVAAEVRAGTRSDQPYEAGGFDLRRDSLRMVDRWKQELSAEERWSMAEAWRAHGLPLYEEGDW
jgi:hypothetical protein